MKHYVSKWVIVIMVSLIVVFSFWKYKLSCTIPALEKFDPVTRRTNKIYDPARVDTYFGHVLPASSSFARTKYVRDSNLPTIDGTPSAPTSMFPFAFNKCSQKCCGTSEYTCNNGCVCVTEDQKHFFATRAGNASKNARSRS